MKNDDSNFMNIFKEKAKLALSNSVEKLVGDLISPKRNNTKTHNFENTFSTPNEKDKNKITNNPNYLSNDLNTDKYNTNKMNKIPPLLINSSQANHPNSNKKNNNKSKLVNLHSTLGKSNKSVNPLSQENFSNLFKLNTDLNVYLNPNNTNRLKSFNNPSLRNKENQISNNLNRNRLEFTSAQKSNYNPFNQTNIISNSKNTTNTFKSTNLRKTYFYKLDKDVELINLDKYNSLVTETMGNYKIESTPVEVNNENTEENLHTIVQNKTLGYPKFNKTSMGNDYLNITYGENAFMKINVYDKDYLNPIDSKKILGTNKEIFNNISTSLINIQKMYYDKTIIGIEKFNEFTKNMCKVRVSNMLPKNTDFLAFFKARDQMVQEKPSNPNGNSTNNMTGILKNDLTAKNNYSDEFLKDNNLDEKNPESSEFEYSLRKDKDKDKRKNKKKKEEVKLKNKIIRPDEMELYAYYKYSTKNFPEGREQFAFDYNLSDLVLFGGIVTNKNNNVWTLDPVSLEWEKKNSDNIPPYPRYGHTGIIYQKKFYVFGGKCKSNNYHYIADLDIFDIVESQWFTPNFSSKSSLELRRNHVADMIGSQMIIHGGMTEDNRILNDAHVLTMNPLKWTSLNISEFTPGPALSCHASAVVLPMDLKYNQRSSLYKFPENTFGKLVSNRMREKGWYLFGGINSEDGNITNDLWILRLGRKPLEWIKPNVRGKPPLPRYSHCLNYYEEGNFLICHGGRNDLSSQSCALNDTHIFDLSKMEWQEIKLFSDAENFNIYHRCGHNSVVFGNKLIIFGGMNNMNYLGSSLFIINLDFNYKFQKEFENENSFDLSNKKKTKNNNTNNDFGYDDNEIKLPLIK